MTTRTRDASAALDEAIVRRIGEPRYRLWFEGKTRLRREGDDLVVGVPNRHFEEWLSRTFRATLDESAQEVYGERLTVRFHIDPDLFQAARRQQESAGELQKTEDRERSKPEAPARGSSFRPDAPARESFSQSEAQS